MRSTVARPTATAAAMRSSAQAGPPGAASAWSKPRAWAEPARVVLPGLVKPSWRHLETTVSDLGGEPTPDDLHQVLLLLTKMDQREAAVLRMRFGLDNEEPKTLKEIGERLGLTRERVRQIESEALAKLAESMNAD